MDNLFETVTTVQKPLAVRMRPRTFDDFYGQEKIIGKGTYLRAMVEQDTVPSLLFYGPSGTGKTTLASIIAEETRSRFVTLNATNTGIAELRKVIDDAKKAQKNLGERTILFLDEIHRFNKSQQDVLLPFVEEGIVTLIGATTENPFFEVNRPLLSRLKLITLSSLEPVNIASVLRRALTDEEHGLGIKELQCEDAVLEGIGDFVNGDARMALNILEQVAAMVGLRGTITQEQVEEVLGRRIHTYDKKGDSHYDIISAFIKSMRGSHPQAVLHYLARMIEAGEDPNFIARRIVIAAAEDVGLADPQALVIANAAAQAAHFVGFPEARIILAEAATYVALAPKSNSTYVAIDRAIHDVRTMSCGEIPHHLRDAHYSGAAILGNGMDYKYPHDYKNGYVEQQYLPSPLEGRRYYDSKENGQEKELVEKWQERMK